MKIWILTKGTDIDPTQILGVYASLPHGLNAFATEARILHATFGCECEETAERHGPGVHMDGATRGDDGSVRLEHRGDWISLDLHDVIGTTQP